VREDEDIVARIGASFSHVVTRTFVVEPRMYRQAFARDARYAESPCLRLGFDSIYS
jgi:hypothetical protein